MNPGCTHFVSAYCRSCSLLHLNYDEQLKLKLSSLQSALAPYARALLPFIPAEPAYGSRCKAKFAAGGTTGAPLLGLPPDENSGVKDLPDCPLHHPQINKIAAWLKQEIAQLKIEPYRIEARQGELKYLILKICPASGDCLVRFVLRSLNQERKVRTLAANLQAAFPAVKVVSLNLLPEHKALTEGETEIILSTEEYLTDQLGKHKLLLHPKAFSQVTPQVALRLYQQAAQHLAQAQAKNVLDLYCGVGAFSFFCAPVCDSVQGVEISEQAIRAATQAIPLNQVPHVSFIAADVATYLQQYPGGADAIIVNPPRRGLDPAVLTQLLRVQPGLILYSSCNPASLRRDLDQLQSHYTVKSLTPFDMFPFTDHAEILALLERSVH